MKKAIIIGAGPAGITAAYELLLQTGIEPLILEAGADTGGISKTINYKGNRVDIGGHRFFSKSKRVMDWWMNILPVENNGEAIEITYHNQHTTIEPVTTGNADPEKSMLVRDRLSRILFGGKFFNYPLQLNLQTLRKLGMKRLVRIGFSYTKARLFPIKNERSLEDFFINRFGRELYETFFRDYTEKVWGVPCTSISPEWGRQRVKGLSLTATLLNVFKKKKDNSIAQKDTATSLIEKFLYPKYGPGQLWETALEIVMAKGGGVEYNSKVTGITVSGKRIVAVTTTDGKGLEKEHTGDYFISSMPVVELINSMGIVVPARVKEIANALQYRDFIMVGMLVKKLKATNDDGTPIKDNWIYIQEKKVRLGRLQIYNNWSPYMVKDPNTVWLGLEYFCNVGDELWSRTDGQLVEMAKQEIASINIIGAADFLDATVIRMPKTYPSYVGAYKDFDEIKTFTDQFENLFLVGRNGMHKYNNQDHSMLTAMQAVENIKAGVTGKANIWAINTDDEYHEG